MEKLLTVWHQSLLYTILCFLRDHGLSRLGAVLAESVLLRKLTLIFRRIWQSRGVRYLYDPSYVTRAWYTSAFYRHVAGLLRRFSVYAPAPTQPWRAMYIGAVFCAVMMIPYPFWNDFCMIPLIFALGLFYYLHHADSRPGMMMALIGSTLILFWGLAAFAVPFHAMQTLTYLLLGILVFFLLSYTLQTKEALLALSRMFCLLLLVLCVIAIIQAFVLQKPPVSTFSDKVAFGSVLILLFPFAMMYPTATVLARRRIPYLIMLWIPVFLAAAATGSKATLIGFWTEFFLFILLGNRRGLWPILLLIPLLFSWLLHQTMLIRLSPAIHGNFIQNLYRDLLHFWNTGFGIDRKVFMDIYRSTASDAQTSTAMLQLPHLRVNPIYITVLVDFGAVFLIGFLTYLLRLAHSTFTSVFTAPKEQKPYFAAAFSTLIGISVSSMLDSALFHPRILLLYWGILGVIRAVRILDSADTALR